MEAVIVFGVVSLNDQHLGPGSGLRRQKNTET